jgi:Uma2 family endonuclease
MIRGDLIQEVGPRPTRLRFSVDHYYKMIELGILENYERAEIIDGELVQKMTIGDRHALVVDLLAQFFFSSLPRSIRVRIQNPLRLSDYDEPEPDIVLADLTKYDGKRHPRPAETILVVEVSDASLKYDRDTKLALYAEAEIPEVWIVNLPNNVIEVHQKPGVGIYQIAKIFKPGELVESSVLPDLQLGVDRILS